MTMSFKCLEEDATLLIMKDWFSRSSSTSTCDDPLNVWSRRMSNLRRPVRIQVVYGVDVFQPTSTYLLLMSTCELIYVDVSSLNVHLWVLTCRRLFIHLNILRQRILLLCRRVRFSCHVECRRICFIRRPVSLIFIVVSAYIRTSVDVHPKITLAVSTYLLHTLTYIQ